MLQEHAKNYMKWRDDLRTTTQRQGTGMLGSSELGFCCLGRACETFKIGYFSYDGSIDNSIWEALLGKEYIPTVLGSNGDIRSRFTAMNDIHNMSFNEIADMIDIFLLDNNFDPMTGLPLTEK